MKNLKKIKCFLLDLDGTIHLSGKVFPGVPEAIRRMRKSARVLFVTNSVWFTREEQAEKLRNMGIDCSRDDIYTGATVAVDYINSGHSGKSVFVLGTRQLKAELRAGGITLTTKKPDLVVVSFDDKLTFARLNRVCDFIRGGVPYYVTHPDLNYPVSGGYLSPDAGGNFLVVRACTGVEPVSIGGKPNEPLARGVLAHMDCQPHEVAMVGDRLMTDIAFANKYGFMSILVLTGEATLADHEKSQWRADLIWDSLADFCLDE